jgi:hypothetical protein
MSDVEVFYFVKLDMGAADSLSIRRHATLASIKERGGEPILETKRVVDTSELDENGFLKEPPVPSV